VGHPYLRRRHAGEPTRDAMAIGVVVCAEGTAQGCLLVEKYEEERGEQEDASVGEQEERTVEERGTKEGERSGV